MDVFLIMFAMGLLLGFVGAGGAGFIIAILTTIFHVPIHIALGTSLSAMVFTSSSGAYSHFRENNVVLRIGVATGLFGGIGAFLGAHMAQLVPADGLKWLTACALFVSAVLLWLRIFSSFGHVLAQQGSQTMPTGFRFWITACGVGILTGIMSGLFGIGATPFIQIGLLVFFGLSVPRAAGTTMVIILPIAFMGGLGYYISGYLDLLLFVKVVTGTVIGSYIGAKFTGRLQPVILKTTMVAVPAAGGILLLLGN